MCGMSNHVFFSCFYYLTLYCRFINTWLFHAFLQVWQRVSWRAKVMRSKNVLDTFLSWEAKYPTHIVSSVKFYYSMFLYLLSSFFACLFFDISIVYLLPLKLWVFFPHPFKLKASFLNHLKMCAYWPFWLMHPLKKSR